jgi:LTR polyprotein gag-polypeptide-like protein/Pol polyprotein
MPMLAIDGSNWVNYHDHIVPILQVKKLADHLVSDTPTPHYTNAGNINGLTPAQCWAKDEDITVVMLNTLIPDTIYIQVKGGNSVKALWDTLKLLFEGRSCNQIMDLTNKLQFSKCLEGDNLRTHFLDLTNLHDQLSTMGKSFSDEDFATILLRSLPDSYKMQVSSIITLADMTNTTISPSLVICMLSDEYDNHVQAGTAGKPPKNKAFKSEDQGKSKKRNHNAQCKNCNKKGHTKAKCWAKGGGREGQFEADWWKGRQGKKDDSKPDSSKKASNNNANSTDIEAWAAIEVIDDPQAQAWYPDHIGEEVANTQQLANKALYRPLTSKIDLYDSGSTCHISPFRHRFVTFNAIPPHSISAANQGVFYAVGKGDLRIDVPNDDKSVLIILKDVFYSLQISLTIVSICHKRRHTRDPKR